MSDFAREVRTGGAGSFIRHGARVRAHASRAPAIPAWLRIVVVLAISLALWALIIASLQGLFTG